MDKAGSQEKKKPGWARRLRNVLIGVAAFLLTMAVAWMAVPQVRDVFAGYYDGILFSMAPENPRYAADGYDDDVFDNEAQTVTADESALKVVYGDDRDFEAPRAEFYDMIRLNRHYKSASLSWLNTHTGTQYIIYTFESGGKTWHYYQHLVDTGYVFCRFE